MYSASFFALFTAIFCAFLRVSASQLRFFANFIIALNRSYATRRTFAYSRSATNRAINRDFHNTAPMTRKHCNINPCGLAACSMYMCVCISVVKVLCIAHVVHRETHVPMTEVSLLYWIPKI